MGFIFFQLSLSYINSRLKADIFTDLKKNILLLSDILVTCKECQYLYVKWCLKTWPILPVYLEAALEKFLPHQPQYSHTGVHYEEFVIPMGVNTILNINTNFCKTDSPYAQIF